MTAFESEVRRIRGERCSSAPGCPVFIGRSPGRLDLMGGNVDYTGGMVFEATIREATWAAVQLRADRRIVFWNPQMAEHGWQDRVEFELDELTDEEAVRRVGERGSRPSLDGVCPGNFLSAAASISRTPCARRKRLYLLRRSAEQRSQLVGGGRGGRDETGGPRVRNRSPRH